MKNLGKRIKGKVLLLIVGAGLLTGFGYKSMTKTDAPPVLQKSTEATKKFREISTEKWTVLSGKRLAFIQKYMGGDLIFEKKGISLEIPEELLCDWDIEEDQTLQVLIQKTSGYAYKIKIYKASEEITYIPGCRIRFPLQEVFPYEEPATVKVTDDAGMDKAFFWDQKQKLLTVQTDQTGTFYVKSRTPLIKEKPVVQVAMIITTGLAAGICSRRGIGNGRHKKRK